MNKISEKNKATGFLEIEIVLMNFYIIYIILQFKNDKIEK